MNWEYVLVGLVRRYVPKKVLFAIMQYRGDGSIEEGSPHACLETWRDQFNKRGFGFAGKHILEIGSGRYARSALQMLAAGAERVTLIDLYAVPLTQPVHREIFLQDCSNLGLNSSDALSRIHVIKGDLTSLPAPPPGTGVDLVISHSVLEHVRDPQAALICCWAWLKPGGITHHIIDLRDHNLRFRYPFEMLTFSDHVWSRWLDLSGGFHLNRWRVPDYVRAANAAGFVDVGYEILSKDKAALEAALARLHHRFRWLSEGILAILSISLYGRKPFEAERP